MTIRYECRGEFANAAVNALHAEGFGHPGLDIGTRLIATAMQHARATGCEWLHVDFEDHLTAFYFRACGFTPTNAGLIALPVGRVPAAARP